MPTNNGSLRQRITEMTNKALRSVPINEEEEEQKLLRESQFDKPEEPDVVFELHPEVEPFVPFKYVPGRPDRVKKVQRFFSDEHYKMLKQEAKGLDLPTTERKRK